MNIENKKHLKMKKVLLLVVAAVFAIGIQSCSTEEEVLLEENLVKQENNIPENAVHFGNSNYSKVPEKIYKRIFVRHKISTTYQERVAHAANVGPQIFDDFYVVFDNGCDYVDDWYVLCKGCGTGTNGEQPSELKESEELKEEDATPDDNLIDPNSSSERYWDCSEVPIRPNLTLGDDNNEDPNPCGFCNNDGPAE